MKNIKNTIIEIISALVYVSVMIVIGGAFGIIVYERTSLDALFVIMTSCGVAFYVAGIIMNIIVNIINIIRNHTCNLISKVEA